MAFYRRNNNWLRHRANKQIRAKHQDLFKPVDKYIIDGFLNYISDKQRWWIVFIFVITVFVGSSVININFLNVSYDTAKILVDQRTANIATIVSITLAIVGFLMTNLAVKSIDIYKLLFKKSYLYPTIYLTLSTIGCFIVVSTFRGTNIPYFDFSSAVIGGTCLVFIILFLIGFLFRTIIQFTGDREITQMLHADLMNEAREKMKLILLVKYSSKEFFEQVEKAGAIEYDFAEALSTASKVSIIEESDGEGTKGQYRQVKVKDIHINRIVRFIKRKKKKSEAAVFYEKAITINSIIENRDSFIWQQNVLNTRWNKFILRNCLAFSSIPKKEKDPDIYRKHFDKRIELLSEEGKYRSLETILESYLELYSIQMKNQI